LLAQALLHLGSIKATEIAWLRSLTIGAGVPSGASTPYQF
jgi:hypothetical protein